MERLAQVMTNSKNFIILTQSSAVHVSKPCGLDDNKMTSRFLIIMMMMMMIIIIIIIIIVMQELLQID